MITETISLEEVPKALEQIRNRNVKGKIIMNKF